MLQAEGRGQLRSSGPGSRRFSPFASPDVKNIS